MVGNMALTKEDLEPVLAKDNLIAKNVANEVATSLIESVMGSVMGTFQSIASTVKDALTQSLMKLLTLKRRIDILKERVGFQGQQETICDLILKTDHILGWEVDQLGKDLLLVNREQVHRADSCV